jgi:hypothetical protein
VVWEGRSREAPPYPDLWPIRSFRCGAMDVGNWRHFRHWCPPGSGYVFGSDLTRVINFVQLSLWGEIDPELTFEVEPLWDMTAKELAEQQKLEAERDQILVDMGAIAPAEVRHVAVNNPNLPYTDMRADDLPDLREEEESGLIPLGAGRGLEAVLDPQFKGGAGGEHDRMSRHQ